MGLGELEILTIYGALAVLLFWVLRRPRPAAVAHWAASYAVAVTDANREDLTAYLTRAQRCRRLGFAAGYVVGAVVATRNELSVLPVASVSVGLGYSAGIVAAEVASRRAPSGAALLAPRDLGQYLPAKLVWIPRALVLAIIVVALLALGTPLGVGAVVVSDAQVAALAACSVGALVVAELLQRAVVRRRQPVADRERLAADDAMRAQSVHAIAGALIIVDGSLFVPLLYRLGTPGTSNGVADLAMVVVPAVAWLAGIWYQNRAWRVRRRYPVATPA
jgi:hypothetical protein